MPGCCVVPDACTTWWRWSVSVAGARTAQAQAFSLMLPADRPIRDDF